MISDECLNKIINHYKESKTICYKLNNKIMHSFINDVIDVLCELKRYRECELRPAIKFKNATLENQLMKIKEEFYEARGAFYRNDIANFKEELTDICAACVTALEMLGAKRRERMDLRELVNKKNEARDYFADDFAELEKAAAPLAEYMRKHCNPHNKIIVTLGGVEVLSGEMGVPTEVQN